MESVSTAFSLPFQSSVGRMKTSFFSLVLLSCCLFSLPNLSHADQARQLRNLIESRRSLTSSSNDSWPEISDFKQLKPASISPQDGLQEADQIKELPGQPEGIDFDQYAGYVTVEPIDGRTLFYYFVESPQNPSTKPLMLWLNGGPGCSSLGYGAMQEIGPFRAKADNKTLSRNQFAWNNVANVIFLESPVGVGFSYSNTTSDYNLRTDRRNADDAYAFLVNWLDRFPQYKERDFFISGESYAGHYVPQLAHTILQHNTRANQTVINLRGIAVGNGLFDMNRFAMLRYEYLWRQSLISEETYAAILKQCNFSALYITDECQAAIDDVDKTGDWDMYNIYAPSCTASNNLSGSGGIYMANSDPCSSNYATSYLNLPEVQTALHAVPNSWEMCRMFPPTYDTVLPVVRQVIDSGIRVWLYGGDLDSVVSVTYIKGSIEDLGLPIKNNLRPWYSNGQVGGHVVEYKGLTFLSVMGAGHTVPTSQPEKALTMISSFLQGQLPPTMLPA